MTYLPVYEHNILRFTRSDKLHDPCCIRMRTEREILDGQLNVHHGLLVKLDLLLAAQHLRGEELHERLTISCEPCKESPLKEYVYIPRKKKKIQEDISPNTKIIS